MFAGEDLRSVVQDFHLARGEKEQVRTNILQTTHDDNRGLVLHLPS